MTDTERKQQAAFLDAQIADARKAARALREREDPSLLAEARTSLQACLRTVESMLAQTTPAPGRLL